MEDNKIPEEHKEPEEEYSFLQEVIKDEAGSRKRRNKRILQIAGFGFIFGIVACFGFCVSKPWMEKHIGSDPKQVTIPRDEEEEEPDENSAEEEQPVLNTESYRQMLKSLKEVAAETSKSVVEITGMAGDGDWTDVLESGEDSVSGIIIADNGQEVLILGQKCPVKDAESIRVTFPGGDSYEAVVKRQDANLNLAVYAVPREEITNATWTEIETAVLGSSNSVGMGDTAIVLGKPFGYANAFSYGIVTTDVTAMNFTDGQYGIVYTDIAGSGAGSGVITNIRGEIIGIIEQTVLTKDSRNQIAGYGISDIKDIIELLSNGAVVPYVGITGVDVTEEMQEQAIPKGIYVKEVETDSPAMAAGIQSGDIITGMDADEIVSVTGYHNLLMKKAEGSRIVLKGCRKGTGGEYVEIDFNVTIGVKE